MSAPWPIFCAYGNGQHQAAYRVKGQYRETVVCLTHLEQAKRWAGARAQVEALQGHVAPPEQERLF